MYIENQFKIGTLNIIELLHKVQKYDKIYIGENMKCIYAIENKLNNKKYIGMTNNFKKRKTNHLWSLRENKHHNKKLQRAYNKYGANNFKIYVLEEVNKMDGLELREKYYIKKYDTYKSGYNCSEGGEKFPDYKMPKKTYEALLKKNIGNKYCLGKKISEEHKKIISNRNKGINNGMYGKKHSLEVKKKLSEYSSKLWEEKREVLIKSLTKANQSEKRKKEVSIQMSGENNHKAVMKKEDVINIRKLLKEGHKIKNIYPQYANLISISGFKKICYKVTWKEI